jgi:hypothetical protein
LRLFEVSLDVLFMHIFSSILLPKGKCNISSVSLEKNRFMDSIRDDDVLSFRRNETRSITYTDIPFTFSNHYPAHCYQRPLFPKDILKFADIAHLNVLNNVAEANTRPLPRRVAARLSPNAIVLTVIIFHVKNDHKTIESIGLY